jgi:hypothetical protein
MGALTSKNILVGLLAPALFMVPVLRAQETASAAEQPGVPAAGAVQPVPATPPAATPDGHTPLAGEPGSNQDKRIFGVLPNYRTADGSIPFSPITTKQKFTIARKDTLDYPSYVLAGFFSGVSQINNSNPSFGQGVKGYAHRYGTAVADQDLGNFMTEAIYPSLLHEDPRYFRKVHGSGKSRFLYAATRVFVTKTDAGNWRFNFSEFLGNATVASIGNAYYPDSRGFGPTAQRMGSQIGTDAVSGILKEFWPDIKNHWFTKHPRTSAD